MVEIEFPFIVLCYLQAGQNEGFYWVYSLTGDLKVQLC